MGNVLLARRRTPRLVAGVLLLFVLGACDDAGSPTVRPFSPLPAASPSPASSPLPASSPRPTPRPTPAAWPAGWDEAFCLALEELAVAQELVVDIPRAIEDEDEDDALALAQELRQSTSTSGELLAEVPEWEPAQPAIDEFENLIDIGGRISRQWIRFLDEGRRAGRTRALELNDEMQPMVEAANDALAELADQGLACPGRSLVLESP